jgi:hypothetical protein
MLTVRYLLTLLILLIANPAAAADSDIFFCENFDDLASWKLMEFPKIKRHSIYSIEKHGEESYLKAESSASASALYFNKTFNVYDYPRIKWRWRINKVYKKGDAEQKTGDDYPIRIFITFKYDPDRASYGDKIKHGIAKLVYDMDAPYRSLNYIWESRQHDTAVITSPYSPDAKMIILQAGNEYAGKWIQEDVDIIRDYRRAFGEDPPPAASIAIMNDSDDTGEGSVSYVDYIEAYR